MRVAPQRLADVVVSAPRFLRDEHRRLLAVRFQRVGGTDIVPIDNSCGSTDNVVLVEAVDDADEAIEARQIYMVFAVPDRLAHILGHLAFFRSQLYLAERVGTNGVERIPKFRVFLHPFEEIHLLVAPVAESV